MKDLSEQTHYEVLELAPGCAIDDLAKAYALARDRYGPGSLTTYALAEPGEAEALLRRVEEAFAVLGDPEQRRTYDAARGFSTPGPSANSSARPSAPAPAPEVVPAPAVVEIASPHLDPPPQAGEGVTEALPPAHRGGEGAAAPVEPVAVAAPEHVPAPEPELAPTPAPERTPEPTPVVVAAAEPAPAPAPELRPEPLAEHKPVRKTESDLPVDAAVTGDALRRVREARGLSLKDVEGRTKIGHWHLENIERERYADLPAQVYLRGFLMSFARELKLDPVRVARSYLEQMRVKSGPKPE